MERLLNAVVAASRVLVHGRELSFVDWPLPPTKGNENTLGPSTLVATDETKHVEHDNKKHNQRPMEDRGQATGEAPEGRLPWKTYRSTSNRRLQFSA